MRMLAVLASEMHRVWKAAHKNGVECAAGCIKKP